MRTLLKHRHRTLSACIFPEISALERRCLLSTVSVNVSGSAAWTDWNGGTHSVPFADVEIRSTAQAPNAAPLGMGTTDINGNFTISNVNVDTTSGPATIFARIYARNPAAQVESSAGTASTTYFMDSTGQAVSTAGNVTLTKRTGSNSVTGEESFSIISAMYESLSYISTLVGSGQTAPSRIDVQYPATGSFFTPTTKVISIAKTTDSSGNPYDNGLDWDAIQHEYGHYVMSKYGFAGVGGGPHSFQQNTPKVKGPAVAWNEGYATFFMISTQRWGGALPYTENTADYGNTSYEAQAGATAHNVNYYDLATGNGVGELDEASVGSVLYHLSIGDQGITLSDQMLFQDFSTANPEPKSFGAAWDLLATNMQGTDRVKLAHVLALQKIAPVETAPADDAPAATDTIPTFTWTANGSDNFIIQFYTSDLKTLIFQTDPITGGTTTFTPTADQWHTIFDGHSTVKWVVEGMNTTNPATPGDITDNVYGGTLQRYWSEAGTINGPSIAIVLDVTGSMSDEIGAVQDALVQYISNLQANLLPGEDPPTIELVTFVDGPSEVISSNDLDAVKNAVEAQSAGGGGDCPEPSAQSLIFAGQNIGPGGTILLITDASSDAGTDLDGTIAALRAKGVTINADISGDCSESVEDTGYAYDESITADAMVSGSTTTDCDCNGDGGAISKESTTYFESVTSSGVGFGYSAASVITPLDTASLGGGGEGLGDEPDQDEINDPGQTPVDDHGNDFTTATPLIVDGPIVNGIVGNAVQDASGNPVTDTDDYFSFNLTAGTTYNIPILTPNDGYATATLYKIDGTTEITSQSSTIGDPSFGFMTMTFTPQTTGVYYLDVSNSFSSTDYTIQISDNPLVGATSSFTLFNTAATQTGGEFLYKDAVADSPTQDQLTDYQSSILNVMDSTFEPTVLSATPNLLPAGQTMNVTLTGRDTNWLQGFSNLTFSDSDITVNSINVLSATSLTASVTMGASATLNQFSDATVTTTLGTATETAKGSSVVEVTAAPTSATTLEVTPNILARGQTQNVTVLGVNTTWDSTSTLSLGPGVTLSNVQVISPTQITAQATVGASAMIGFRVATITTGFQTDTLDRAITITNTVLSSSVPSINSITPAQDSLGSHIDISVVGANTNFLQGTTTASLGSGITVDSVDVTDATHAVIHVDIAAGAAVGYRNVTMTTGSETAALLNGFFISATPASPVVTGPAAQAVFAGQNQTFSLGSFTAGGNGPWNVDVNWGDGSADTTFSATAVGSLTPQSHTYTTVGQYGITITITNSTTSTSTGGGSGTIGVVNNVGMILTDKSKPSLSINGTLDLTGSGNAYVNSSSATAAAVNGKKASATASLFSIVGNIKKGSKFTGTTKTSQTAIADPLAGLAAPTKPATVSSKADKIKAKTATTIQPGTYIGGINDSGTGTLTLAPGVYYLQGGGFTVGAKSTVTGTGVTIYLVGKGSINLSGTVTLTPATSGAYAGIVFFQDRADNSAIKINGHTTINGIFYAPDAKVTIGSKAHYTDNAVAADSIDALSIFSDVTISAGGNLTIDTADNIPTAMLA